MHKEDMAVATVSTVALMMTWVFPALIDDLRKVCINTGMKDDLMSLNGVGPKKADRIIAHRKQNGPFQIPQDIMKVKGIGRDWFEANQDDIVIDYI